MKHLFVPYELAVIAKEKGFNNPVIATYDENKKLTLFNYELRASSALMAPLYQQLVDWFRDAHHLHPYVVPYGDCKSWSLVNIWYTNRKSEDLRLLLEINDKYDKVKFDSYYKALDAAIKEIFNLI